MLKLKIYKKIRIKILHFSAFTRICLDSWQIFCHDFLSFFALFIAFLAVMPQANRSGWLEVWFVFILLSYGKKKNCQNTFVTHLMLFKNSGIRWRTSHFLLKVAVLLKCGMFLAKLRVRFFCLYFSGNLWGMWEHYGEFHEMTIAHCFYQLSKRHETQC